MEQTKITDLLARIDERKKLFNLTDRALSLAAGLSEDGIRNWRRSAIDNPDGSVRLASVAKIAGPLRTSVAWLMSGTGEPDGTQGFREPAAFERAMEKVYGGQAGDGKAPFADTDTLGQLTKDDETVKSQIKIATDGAYIQIFATVDRESIAELRRKLDLAEQMLSD